MKRRILFRLEAAVIPPADGLRATGGTITLEAASSDAAKPRRFSIEAYNGGAMMFEWSKDPIVVDLAGMDVGTRSRPMLKDHSPSLIVGHSTDITKPENKRILVAGVVSGAGAVAREVVASADAGFPWQASIGADVLRMEPIRSGVDVTVNGQKFTGPLNVVRASRLKEVSFVALGADDTTAARMAAQRSTTTEQPSKDTLTMKTKIHLAALLALVAAYPLLQASLNERAEVVKDDDETGKAGEATLKAWAAEQPKPKVEPKDDDADPAQPTASLKAMRAEAAAETRRINAISKACGTKHAETAEKAIAEGWSVEQAELHVLRAERAAAPRQGGFSIGASGEVTGSMLEAAAAMTIFRDRKKLEAEYDVKTLEAANKHFRGPITLGQIFIEAARANGYMGRALKVNHEVIQAAFGNLNAAGVSVVDIGGILSNIANKSLLAGFNMIEKSWRDISKIAPVTDFKTITRYRLTGDNTYEKVGKAGEIKHGKLGEESFTNKADSYAKILGITREDLINDDLGALDDVPRMLGRGAALKLNDVFWTEWLDDSSFFTTGNKNYFSGSPGSLLSVDGLTTAEQKFLDMLDTDGKPFGVDPAILLVPTALSTPGAVLMRSTEIRNPAATAAFGTANPHAGKFRLVVSRYLTSATAWYLAADPADVPAIETVFLNGQEAPTVESAQAEFNTLGVAMRGYHDFGVSKQDKRAAVKAKGAA